ncbi:MAG: bifunctional phosphoglucose/phosphomannose isomerase [Thermoproteales archaeon]|nr:bifunctional phosphoglucose/phosphomannose isomerase [Thermoproteales archaeon]
MHLHNLRKNIDKNDMYSLLVNFPSELEKSFKEYEKINIPETLKIRGKIKNISEIRNVVIIGMGGSAIGGDIIISYLYKKIKIPIFLIRDYVLPGFINNHTLLVGVSYSGNTDETLLAFLEGIKLGAYPIIITSDGLFEKISDKINVPIFKLPIGRPPRTSTAYMLSALLHVLEKSNVVSLDRDEIYSTFYFLKKIIERYSSLEENTLPVQLALTIKDKIPLIYTYKPYTPIGYRFKTQLNENAKYHAFFGEFPEVDHNEIMGWENETNKDYIPIFLEGRFGEESTKTMMKYWKILFDHKDIKYITLKGIGKNILADMLYLLLTGDFTSYILALLEKIDPTPVTTITGLKDYLTKNTSLRQRVLEEMKNL